jgi:hypothetical protein
VRSSDGAESEAPRLDADKSLISDIDHGTSRVEEREQVSVGRREQRQARLVHAYCSHGAVVARSVDEGKSEPDCRRGDEADALADCSRERPLARRRLAPRRRGVALGASRSADSGTIRS